MLGHVYALVYTHGSGISVKKGSFKIGFSITVDIRCSVRFRCTAVVHTDTPYNVVTPRSLRAHVGFVNSGVNGASR